MNANAGHHLIGRDVREGTRSHHPNLVSGLNQTRGQTVDVALESPDFRREVDAVQKDLHDFGIRREDTPRSSATIRAIRSPALPSP